MRICLFLLCLCATSSYSQTNLVPNPSFENGSGGTGDEQNWGLFGLSNWEIGYDKINNISGGCQGANSTGNNSLGCSPKTTWMTYNEYAQYLTSLGTCPGVTNNFTSRCLHMDHGEMDHGDRARVQLTTPVKAWKSYTLRIKIFCYETPAELRVYLSHWGLHWNSNKSDNHKTLIAILNPVVANCNWTGYTASFSTSEDMENLILTCDKGELLIDDVEVTEGSNCPNLLLQQNKNYYTYEPTYEAYDIMAGYNVGATNGLGDVTVRSGADISYKAVHEVSLEPGFNVESGALFHAYLAPCGKECFPPEAITSDVNEYGDDLCGVPPPGTTYQLGANPIPGMTYVWTAALPSDLTRLSATNISNPVFTPPTNGYGTITYTLTVTNACGEIASKVLAINYNTQGALVGGYVETVNDGYYWENLSYNDVVSAIGIEVYNPNYSSIQHSLVLHKGIDFTGTSKVWNYPYANEITACFNYYPVKLYYKTYCDDNWYPCSSPQSCATPFYKNCSVVDKTTPSGTAYNTNNDIIITPSPNNGTFQIAVTKNDQAIAVKEIKVFDMMGKEIWSTGPSANNTANVNISDYSQGIYYVRTVNELGEIEMKKLVKQ